MNILDDFYVVLKLNLKDKNYECVYSHIREVYEKVRNTESYEEFISQYVERYVYVSDKKWFMVSYQVKD